MINHYKEQINSTLKVMFDMSVVVMFLKRRGQPLEQVRTGGSSPDVCCRGDGGLVDDLWGDVFWRSVSAVVLSGRLYFQRAAEVHDADLLAARRGHHNILWLWEKVNIQK